MSFIAQRAPSVVSAALLVFFSARSVAHADALDDIRAHGTLRCAVSTDQDDYSLFDAHGDVSAFGADLCRAVAAAIFPSGAKTTIVGTGDEITAIRAVHDRQADLAFGTTPDPALAAELSLSYAAPFLIDGQGFLVNSGENIAGLDALAGKRICFVEGSPEGATLKTAMADRRIPFTAFPFSERGEMMGALATGHCNAVTGDATELAAERLSLPALARNGVLLGARITTDPWSPVLRNDEPRLLAIVDAVEDGLVSAATLGIDRHEALSHDEPPPESPEGRLLGDSGWQAKGLDLDERFLRRAIATVGNQAELFRRDLGDGSPLKLPIGANAPLERGGALLSIPVSSPR